jgi:hypothetical protein
MKNLRKMFAIEYREDLRSRTVMIGSGWVLLFGVLVGLALGTRL